MFSQQPLSESWILDPSTSTWIMSPIHPYWTILHFRIYGQCQRSMPKITRQKVRMYVEVGVVDGHAASQTSMQP